MQHHIAQPARKFLPQCLRIGQFDAIDPCQGSNHGPLAQPSDIEPDGGHAAIIRWLVTEAIRSQASIRASIRGTEPDTAAWMPCWVKKSPPTRQAWASTRQNASTRRGSGGVGVLQNVSRDPLWVSPRSP